MSATIETTETYEYLTLAETGNLLGVSRQRVDQLVREGKLHVVSQERPMRIAATEAIHYLRSKQESSAGNGRPDTPDNCITPEEAAKRLKVCVATVHHYIKNGRLPSVRRGRFWFVVESSVDNFVKPKRGRPRKAVVVVTSTGEHVTGVPVS